MIIGPFLVLKNLNKCRYDSALSDFDKTMVKLRGNPFIDYKQLGLQYKLYSCEVG